MTEAATDERTPFSRCVGEIKEDAAPNLVTVYLIHSTATLVILMCLALGTGTTHHSNIMPREMDLGRNLPRSADIQPYEQVFDPRHFLTGPTGWMLRPLPLLSGRPVGGMYPSQDIDSRDSRQQAYLPTERGDGQPQRGNELPCSDSTYQISSLARLLEPRRPCREVNRISMSV
ncbi:hypothetical protein F4823DRAFT_235597 [Ustulina deusta]|nr:hypothetical protein F4823DRAFT_235597 [Ustulina deusta]